MATFGRFVSMAGPSGLLPVWLQGSGHSEDIVSAIRFSPLLSSGAVPMSQYRRNLPMLDGNLFLSDGGLETTLVYHDGIELPCFAAFDLLKHDAGIERLRRYFESYISVAREHGCGFVLEAPTWRANPDWGERIGYSRLELADANRKAVGLMLELRDAFERRDMPMVISGNIGPRGDGYRVDGRMSADEARAYHGFQVEIFGATDADLVSAFTLNYVEEAVGIVLAARDADIPVVISFTVETDGRLPSGDSLATAIRRTDEATDGYAAYYMINCAHPTHLASLSSESGGWTERLRGLRANASHRSHAELDEATELDEGDPSELGGQYAWLRQRFPHVRILGGCCGTDQRHIREVARACLAA
jgi:homocysteine S-methyltransferase